jgi:hypothetical protein
MYVCSRQRRFFPFPIYQFLIKQTKLPFNNELGFTKISQLYAGKEELNDKNNNLENGAIEPDETLSIQSLCKMHSRLRPKP